MSDMSPKCASASVARRCWRVLWWVVRHAKGLFQEDLAYEAGVNRSYMSRLEKGASYPGLEIIGKLTAVLEIEPSELLKLPARKKARSR
jgi:transcriptional regulator with XRE-family HTH domain